MRGATGHNLAAIRRLVAASLLAATAAPARAQDPLPPSDLARASLEELLNVTITSASRKEERSDDAAAAVYVLTHDDIVRSGMRSLPDLFRLVPGMDVAQVTNTNWAVTIRGFNQLGANKLQVLVDGRSVYKRSTSGVFWDLQDLVLDDIERIEVIRGAGGAIWGANSVNGVINIVTRPAADTAGATVRLGVGSFDGTQSLFRYGGAMPKGAYRAYAQWTYRRPPTLADGTPVDRGFTSVASGLRLDWTGTTDSLTIDGNAIGGTGNGLWTAINPIPGQPPNVGQPTELRSGNLLGNWTHRLQNGSRLEVRAFADLSHRDQLVIEHESTYDLDVLYRTGVRGRHDIAFGGGYRDADNVTDGNLTYSFLPGTQTEGRVVSFFGQDEIALPASLRATLDMRLEDDVVAGWGVQPTGRIVWDAPRGQRVWASAARALRTPSAVDLGVRYNYAFFVPGPGAPPILVGLQGNRDFQSEKFLDFEAGYRASLGSRASLDVVGFRGRYTDLATQEPMAPVFEVSPGPPHVYQGFQFQNGLRADTSGVEIAGHLAAAAVWRLDGSYSGFRITHDGHSLDPTIADFDGTAPSHQWQVHSSLWVGRRTQADVSFFHVGPVRSTAVAAYDRADARVEVTLSKEWTAIVAGRNLLSPYHVEFLGLGAGVAPIRVPRAADVQLVWRLR